MRGAVIKHILSTNPHTRKWFHYCHGFSSPDLDIPIIHHYPALIVLNSDDSNGPGEHWCILIIWNPSESEFFDPYGLPLNFYNFDEAVFKVVKNVTCNTKCVQGIQPTCGHHCIFFSINRAAGHSMQFIVKKLYSDSLRKNDIMVYNYIRDTYGDEYAKYN